MPATPLRTIILLAFFLLIGLPSRLLPPDSLPHWYVAYAGDATWAAVAYCLFTLCLPKLTALTVAALTLAFATLIELSQFYHAPWIDQFRSFKPAALILGHTFLWTDLLAYAAGISLACLIDIKFLRHPKTRASPW